jgi:SAM-dependent methyltransferase
MTWFEPKLIGVADSESSSALMRPLRYGLDGPGPFAWALGVGVVCVVAGAVAWPPAIWVGVGLLGYAGGHLFASVVGKPRSGGRLIDSIPWRGDECVLDVGCGHGLLLIEAARRLTTGRAVGVDVWRQKDQWHNSRGATIDTVRDAGVADRVEVSGADARALPFRDDTFDVVVSSLVIHNISDREGRAQAVREIARVLRPGGRVAILDIAGTSLYANELEAAGLVDVHRSAAALLLVPTARRLSARRP